MITLRLSYIEDHLKAIGLDELAHALYVENGYTKKIHARQLLLGFLLLYNQGENSLEHWASCIESFSNKSVSKQAVDLRCDERHAQLFETVARRLMRQQVPASGPAEETLAAFGRVLLADSTCFSLHRDLAEAFPSSYSHSGEAATARLQLTYELKSEQVLSADVGSYRDNDQGYSREILPVIEPGDLLIRDLGYFSLDVFEALAQREAFYVSRLRYGVVTTDPVTKTAINLLERLRNHPGEVLDLEVLVGAEKQLPARLIAKRLPKEVADSRRRKAKARRDRRTRYTAHYGEWLGWSIFITNVPEETATAEQIEALYRLRWRVEIIFKGFKSAFRSEVLLSGRKMSSYRVRMTLFGWLCYALLLLRPIYCFYAIRLKAKGRYVSLLKFCTWLRIHLVELLMSDNLESCLRSVERHCTYEKRRKRQHHYQKMEAITFP